MHFSRLSGEMTVAEGRFTALCGGVKKNELFQTPPSSPAGANEFFSTSSSPLAVVKQRELFQTPSVSSSASPPSPLSSVSLPPETPCAATAKVELFPSLRSQIGFSSSALAYLLQKGSVELKDFEWTEDERPDIAYNEFSKGDNLPVIDISSLVSPASSQSDQIARKKCIDFMVEASREWGFFQVVGHGVPMELVRRMEAHALRFFGLPLLHKREVLRDPHAGTTPVGYTYSFVGTTILNDFPWLESLQIPSSPYALHILASKIWPNHYQDFMDVVIEFRESMRRLTMLLLEALIHYLDAGSGAFGVVKKCVGHMAENSIVRLNCYPTCPQPSKTLGLGAHSDPHILTVLHQDQVGGLQIRDKDSQWITIKPNPDAFVVNIGDVLQVWSNDIYNSIEHRAVCNDTRPRLSMAFFLNPLDDSIIVPLCGSSNAGKFPHRYKPFTWKQYRDCMYAQRLRGKSNLQHVRVDSNQPRQSPMKC